MKKSTVTLIVVGTIVGVLLLAAMIVGVGWIAVKGVKNNPPTAEERKLILSPAAFEQFDQTLDPQCDTFKAISTFGISKEIEYVHDCEQSELYVQSTAAVSPTASDARQNWLLLIGGYKAGMAIAANEVKVEPRENLLTFGDQRYAAVLKNGDNPVGNVFVIRQGRVVHSLLITGLYFDDPDAVRDLLGPLVEESKRQYGREK